MMWTDDMENTLMDLWNRKGWTATEIAEFFGKTRNAIMGKIDRLRGHEKGKECRRGLPLPKKKKKKKFAAPKVVHRAAKAREVGRAVELPPAPLPPLLPVLETSDGWWGIAAQINQLKNRECRWPIGEPVSSFCRAPVTENHTSYCPYHRQKSAPGNGMKVGE